MEHSTRGRVWRDDELLALPKDGHRFELIEDVLHDMSPGGALHGAVSVRIASLLWQHVEQSGLGIVYDGQTGYRLDEATCVSPDVSLVCRQRLSELLPDPHKFLRGAPDLAVEVLSPNDSTREMAERIQLYFRFGTRLLWVVDPQLELVRVYESPARFKVVQRTGHLDGGGVLPDFSAAASRIFPVS